MRNKTLDRVIKKLYFSRALQQELRDDADAVRQRYHLSTAELQAVQSGDARELISLGMDARLVHDATPTVADKLRLRAVQAGAAVLAGVAGLMMMAPGVQAAPRLSPGFGRRVSPRRVLRRVRARISARAGEVHARHARRAIRRVRARMLESGDTPKLDPRFKSGNGISLQDPIQ